MERGEGRDIHTHIQRLTTGERESEATPQSKSGFRNRVIASLVYIIAIHDLAKFKDSQI
jgi:hypothetical protein